MKYNFNNILSSLIERVLSLTPIQMSQQFFTVNSRQNNAEEKEFPNFPSNLAHFRPRQGLTFSVLKKHV